eukprot:1089458-Prymnesium_polylepis.2
MSWKPKGSEQFVKANALNPAVRRARAAFREDLQQRFVTDLPPARKETMAICTVLDPRFKTYTFLGATDAERLWANQILKATFEDKWSAMPLAP